MQVDPTMEDDMEHSQKTQSSQGLKMEIKSTTEGAIGVNGAVKFASPTHLAIPCCAGAFKALKDSKKEIKGDAAQVNSFGGCRGRRQ